MPKQNRQTPNFRSQLEQRGVLWKLAHSSDGTQVTAKQLCGSVDGLSQKLPVRSPHVTHGRKRIAALPVARTSIITTIKKHLNELELQAVTSLVVT